jgi:hypothetical protein
MRLGIQFNLEQGHCGADHSSDRNFEFHADDLGAYCNYVCPPILAAVRDTSVKVAVLSRSGSMTR